MFVKNNNPADGFLLHAAEMEWSLVQRAKVFAN